MESDHSSISSFSDTSESEFEQETSQKENQEFILDTKLKNEKFIRKLKSENEFIDKLR